MGIEAPGGLTLYGYWRSSSAYRVRIALNLKGLACEHRPVHLVRDGGEQNRDSYRRINPLGLVPALRDGDHTVVQSTAICEYLEERFPEPALLPRDRFGRSRVRAIFQTIACEIQPLNNLGIMQFLKQDLGLDDAAYAQWYGQWIRRGFNAVEAWLGDGSAGRFCHGDTPGLADCYLVPQVYNAERFDCDLQPYPHIRRITAECRALKAFIDAAPENQPDAET